MQDIKALTGFIRKQRTDMPAEVRLSAEIALHTLRGMRSPSFHQSQALQELARRNFADLDAKLRARELSDFH